MIILNTVSNEKVWGTSRLHDYFGNPGIEKIGSVYTVSGIKEISCEIIYGDENKDLYSAVKASPEKFGLANGVDYPLIISFTSADKDLSIQVHPTDDYAKENEKKMIGKSEAWYFIEKPNKGWIYAETDIDDKKIIKENILNKDYESVVNKVKVDEDDIAFVEAGTIHALTEGSLVYEIQQSSDITYRLYDYDRLDKDGNPRQLHLEDGINTIVPSNKVSIKNFKNDYELKYKPFNLLRTKISGEYINNNNIAQAITITNGRAVINSHEIIQGQSVLILPGESVNVDKAADEVVVATPNLYFYKETI